MDARARTWAFIVWPESAPEGWQEILANTHIPMAISPLHDRDTWTERDEALDPRHKAGTPKKPHYHVVLYYGGKKGPKQVLDDLRELDVHHVERVRDTMAYNRYLCHMDNPEKVQYSPDEIRRINGAVCEVERALSSAERHSIMTELTLLVDDTPVLEYMDLVRWCIDNRPEWVAVAQDNTIYFTHIIASKRHSCERERGRHA